MRVVLALMLMLAASAADAKPLCVNPSTGSDSNTYAANTGNMDGTGTACWLTVGRAVWGSTNQASPNAAEAATAGDTVYIAAGTYTAPGKASRTDPAFNPANSGSSGSPIVLRAVGTVNLALSSSAGPTLGCFSRDYITWIGFSVDEANGVSEPDTGAVVGWDSTGCRFEALTIDGNGTGHNRGDNHTGVRLEECIDCYIGHSTIHDVYSCQSACTGGDPPVNAHNGSAIQTYASTNFVIEHNLIYNAGAGLFIKGGPWTVAIDGGTIRYNLIHTLTQSGIAVFAGSPAASGTPALIYQNVVYGAVNCFRYWFFGDTTNDPTYTHFVNNTCYNATNGFSYNGTPVSSPVHGFTVWNNVVSTVTSGISSTASVAFHQNAAEADHEHQVYHSVSGTFGVLDGGSTNISLATWQGGSYNQDAASPAAITTDPLFANIAAADFRLCTGSGTPHASCSGASPALTHGRVTNSIGGSDGATIPAGAYITGNETIGPSVSEDPPASTGPVRLRIRGNE